MKLTAAVAVVGGGPAGAISALLLARAGVEVVLIADGRRSRFQRGEVLSPKGRSALRHLGLWEHIPLDILSPCYATRIAWDSEKFVERVSMTDAYGPSWHVERSTFDPWLISQSIREGVSVVGGRVSQTRRTEAGWEFDVAGQAAMKLHARYAVFATGRWPWWIWTHASRLCHDRLCAVFRQAAVAPGTRGLWVASIPHGWCYLTATVNGAVVGFLSDADIITRLGGRDTALYHAIESAPLLRSRVVEFCGDARIAPAWVASVSPSYGDRWVGVGDAVLSHDPLAGQGLMFAMNSAVQSTQALLREMSGEVATISEYGSWVHEYCVGFLSHRQRLYGAVRRWPDQPFWQRRAPQLLA